MQQKLSNKTAVFSSAQNLWCPKRTAVVAQWWNLKNLNHYIPYSCFKIEGLFLLKKITLQEGVYMCKIDVKDAYFSVPQNQKSQKFESFKWKDVFSHFLCLWNDSDPSTREKKERLCSSAKVYWGSHQPP